MPVGPDDLKKLRDPFGELIPDREVNAERVRKAIQSAKKVISVGDATAERLVSFKIIPDIAVIDGKERRSSRINPIEYPAKVLHCTNPRGTVTREAIRILKQALEGPHPTIVVVEGEEDMLALPLIYLAQEGSVLLYGQPLEGLVAVEITRSKQDEAKALMDRISHNDNT